MAPFNFEFPPVPAGEPLKVSATSYLAFQQCPAQAQARYRGQYPSESRASFTGALAHRIIARHLTSGPIADVPAASREEIGTALNHKMAGAGIHRPSDLEGVIAAVGDLYARFRRFPDEGFEAAEVELAAEPAIGVTLVGKIDAIYRDDQMDPLAPGPILRDWKTGALGEPLSQLLFYALLWALASQQMVSAVEAVSLLTGERLRHKPSAIDLTRVAVGVAELVTAFRTVWTDGAELERRGGPWCRYCPLLSDCPEGQSAGAINR
jgi:hypothetical protein